jgi:hypothetical protein
LFLFINPPKKKKKKKTIWFKKYMIQQNIFQCV